MPARPAQPPRLVILDLDGVVYRGNQVVAGMPELIDELHRRGVAVRYATNNSMASRERYVERLDALGIKTNASEIVTSTSATIAYLNHHLPAVRSVLIAGSDAMSDELAAAGLEVARAADLATDGYQGEPLSLRFDAVIVGLDQHYDYGRVAVAATAVGGGAMFVATNTDLRYPTPVGFLPGAGSLVAAIGAAAGGVKPLVIGKPETAMFESILDEVRIPAQAAVVVGDNADADILAARRSGIFAVLVLTGVTDADIAVRLEGDRRPDVVVQGPPELRSCFDEWLRSAE